MDEQTQRMIQEADAAWRTLKPDLDRYDGACAASTLSRLREKDPAMWIAMRNKIYQWMSARFSRKAMSESEEKMDMSRMGVGQARFVDWLYKIYPDRDDPYNWNDEDLKYMIQEIREGAAD